LHKELLSWGRHYTILCTAKLFCSAGRLQPGLGVSDRDACCMCIYLFHSPRATQISLTKTMENVIEINVCLGIDDARSNVLAWRIL
jgi:hypothetical protein